MSHSAVPNEGRVHRGAVMRMTTSEEANFDPTLNGCQPELGFQGTVQVLRQTVPEDGEDSSQWNEQLWDVTYLGSDKLLRD